MDDSNNQKLECVKKRLEELIADLDRSESDARRLGAAEREKSEASVDPRWLLQLTQQREVLTAVVQLLSDWLIEANTLSR